MNEQIFRFCCRCVREAPIKKGRCYFCKGTFILSGPQDELYLINKKQKVEETY